jgi:beta-lactamase regulating signal transducer with metallopeptidase domain
MWQLLTQSPLVERAGWLLVHSLWQFALVAILAIVLQRATRRRSAVLRYRTLLATMLLMVAMPVVTWFQHSPGGTPAAMAEIQSVETLPPVPPPRAAFAPGNGPHMHPAEAASVRLAGKTAAQRAEPTLPQHVSGRSAWALPQLEQRLHPWLPAIVLVWLAGACLAALRPLWGWYTARRLRTTGVTRVPDVMHAILERTARRLKLDPTVELLQSAWVQSPAVVGYLRPVILLPVCVVTGLPESELELILAHELAHIRRHDYLVNLLQTLAETLFFYHPAVWWLSRQIRNERENCCDDVAMDIAGSRADYARALLAVEELRAVPSRFAVAAGGGSLLARIRRIAGREPAPRATGGASILCLVLVSLGLGIAVTWGAAPAEEKSKPAAAAVTAPNVAGKNAGKPSAAGPLGPQTASFDRRAVHKRIKDFPDKVDLSTPESALAACARKMAQKDVLAAQELGWVKIAPQIARDVEDALKHDPNAPQNLEEQILNAELVEVLTYRGDVAAVIVKIAGKAQKPYAWLPVWRIRGVWKCCFGFSDLGGAPDGGIATSVRGAEEEFVKERERWWREYVKTRDIVTAGQTPWFDDTEFGKRLGANGVKAEGKPASLPDKRGATASATGKPASPAGDQSPSKGPAKAKLTLESLGFASSQSDPGYDGEIDKLIKQKKYTLLKTFESKDGRKQYAYRFTAANGRQVNRNFSMPLDHVDSWADYQAKRQRQDAERNERISQALTSGRFRLVNLEVMQIHLCRDVASGMEFKVQRIQLSDGTETALPRADYGPVPPSVKQTKWQEHVEAIRDGKRELLNLETVNSYAYEMTADDGTKVIFHYGGNDPLDALVKRAAPVEPGVKTARSTEIRSGETVLGVRPQGNCSISGRVISEANGKPVAGAHMYLHYSATHGSIFVNTDGDGKFEIKNLPTGPFSLCSSFTPGYQDAAYSPQGQPGRFPQFSLKDGEHRSGIVLKIKPACRISGRILDENGRAPDSKTWNVLAWVKNDYGDGYHSQHGFINHRDGSYRIDGLARQPVYVMAINWRAAREGNASPPVYYPGVFSRGDAKQVTFDRSPHVDGVDITLRKQGGLILEGTVRDEAGHPIPEAFVVVHRRDLSFDFNTAYTDAQGHYRIQGLGAGELMIHVDAAHRGFVRTRAPIALDKSGQNTRRDFTLHRGVLISGRFTDEQGRPWQIGESYAYAAQISQDRPARTQFELNEGDFSLTEFQNKYRPKNVARAFPGTFLHGEGDYDCDQAIFPTTNTFLIQGLMPGHTLVGLSPNKERQKVVKILYQGRDVRTCGIDTQPGQEIKDVTVVVGQDP